MPVFPFLKDPRNSSAFFPVQQNTPIPVMATRLVFIVRGNEPVMTDYTILPKVLIYITFNHVLARQSQVRVIAR